MSICDLPSLQTEALGKNQAFDYEYASFDSYLQAHADTGLIGRSRQKTGWR